ncbi:hypothetical protein [Metasolibacillus meyeri]|uniref:hypothetical protein n=1 Tax=Metasolibacillus meyeri TaxID=1071052 RepID=UPI000D31E674|nr:hypothetical protein [Metasolibacillus meyeri]
MMLGRYMATKLAAAGFAMTIIFSYLLVVSNFNLYTFSEMARIWMLWAVIFGYGIVITCVIDAVIERWEALARYKTALYLLAGALFFLPFGLNTFTLIAGIVGAFVAGMFLLGQTLATNYRACNIAFIVIPLLFLLLIQLDYTTKKGWEATSTSNSYHVTYEHFNGEHKIPLVLKKGDIVTNKIVMNLARGVGGHHLENASGQILGQTELGHDRLQAEIEQDGTYYIVLTGERAAGDATVEWEIQ